jgi:hypothetical protein
MNIWSGFFLSAGLAQVVMELGGIGMGMGVFILWRCPRSFMSSLGGGFLLSSDYPLYTWSYVFSSTGKRASTRSRNRTRSCLAWNESNKGMLCSASGEEQICCRHCTSFKDSKPHAAWSMQEYGYLEQNTLSLANVTSATVSTAPLPGSLRVRMYGNTALPICEPVKSHRREHNRQPV